MLGYVKNVNAYNAIHQNSVIKHHTLIVPDTPTDMNRKLYKAAYNNVLDKKYFYRHLIIFVVGNFLLFFLSLQSWTPSIFYLLTLIWIRVLALHFANAYPEVVKDFGFKDEAAEESAIDKEMRRIKKRQKAAKKRKDSQENTSPELPLKPILTTDRNKKYRDTDLV